jgi:hypothetical protein
MNPVAPVTNTRIAGLLLKALVVRVRWRLAVPGRFFHHAARAVAESKTCSVLGDTDQASQQVKMPVV